MADRGRSVRPPEPVIPLRVSRPWRRLRQGGMSQATHTCGLLRIPRAGSPPGQRGLAGSVSVFRGPPALPLMPVRAVMSRSTVVRPVAARSWKSEAPGKSRCTMVPLFLPGARFFPGNRDDSRTYEQVMRGWGSRDRRAPGHRSGICATALTVICNSPLATWLRHPHRVGAGAAAAGVTRHGQ